jgi:hypothetical protein
MRRVYIRLLGASKYSLPSRKNGRRSGKKTAKRVSPGTCAASASTCEKSGRTVALSVMLGAKRKRTLPPRFALDAYDHPAPVSPDGAPASDSVNSGFSSVTNSRCSPPKPRSVPDCTRNDAAPRRVGIQVCW